MINGNVQDLDLKKSMCGYSLWLKGKCIKFRQRKFLLELQPWDQSSRGLIAQSSPAVTLAPIPHSDFLWLDDLVTWPYPQLQSLPPTLVLLKSWNSLRIWAMGNTWWKVKGHIFFWKQNNNHCCQVKGQGLCKLGVMWSRSANQMAVLGHMTTN